MGLRISDVYNFAMPRFVHVQIDGVEKSAKIEADAIERQQHTSGSLVRETLILKNGDMQVGEFAASKVIGWWFQDER
jgi:hypothetical protein